MEKRFSTESIDKILKFKKPFRLYFTTSNWQEIHKDIICEKIKKEYIYGEKIFSSECHMILYMKTPEHLDKSDCDEIVKIAIDKFENACSEIKNNNNLLSLLREKSQKAILNINGII